MTQFTQKTPFLPRAHRCSRAENYRHALLRTRHGPDLQVLQLNLAPSGQTPSLNMADSLSNAPGSSQHHQPTCAKHVCEQLHDDCVQEDFLRRSSVLLKTLMEIDLWGTGHCNSRCQEHLKPGAGPNKTSMLFCPQWNLYSTLQSIHVHFPFSRGILVGTLSTLPWALWDALSKSECQVLGQMPSANS